MKSKLFKLAFGVLASLALLFSFQNCGQAPAGEEDGGSNKTAGRVSSPVYVDSKVFPYKLMPNHFSYLSCNKGLTYSFKVGGFSDAQASYPLSAGGITLSQGGVGLRNESMTEFNRLNPNLTATERYNRLSKALNLNSIPGAGNLQPFMSVRAPKINAEIADPNEIVIYPNYDKTLQYHFSMGPLSQDLYTSQIAASPTVAQNYFPKFAKTEQRSFVTDIAFSNSDDRVIADVSYGTGGLFIGFADANSYDTEAALPLIAYATPNTSDLRLAYGILLIPSVTKQVVRDLNTGTPESVLVDRRVTALDERDTSVAPQTPQSTNWVCKSFKVVRGNERGNMVFKLNGPNSVRNATCTKSWVNNGSTTAADTAACIPSAACPVEVISATATDAMTLQKKALSEAMRRFLPVEDWDINFDESCVVSNKADVCYGGSPKVVYDDIFFPANDYGVAGHASAPVVTAGSAFAGCGGNGFLPCAHYLNFCYRQN